MKPLIRRRLKQQAGGNVRRDTIEDYTQQEVDRLRNILKQNGRESLLSTPAQWLVTLKDLGAGGTRLDAGDAAKFITLSQEPEVQVTFWDWSIQAHPPNLNC